MTVANGKLICSATTGKLLCHPTTGKLLYGIEAGATGQIIVTATSWPTDPFWQVGDIWTAISGPPYTTYYAGVLPWNPQLNLLPAVPCQVGSAFFTENAPENGYYLVGPASGEAWGTYQQFTNGMLPPYDVCIATGKTVTFAIYTP